MKKSWFLIIFVLIIVSGCSTPEWDNNADIYNFTSGIAERGIDAAEFATGIDAAIKASRNNIERAELLLVMSRVKNDNSLVFFAMDFYHKAAEDAENKEEKAILLETIASIESSRYNHLRAAEAWRRAGNKQRALMHFNIASGRKNEWQHSAIDPGISTAYPASFSQAIIGNTRIELSKDDLLVSQADMVARNLKELALASPFSENLEESVEGAAIKELEAQGLKHEIAAGSVIKEVDGIWYAMNEEGALMFEVPASNVIIPTTRFLENGIAVVVDTSSIGMIVGQAVQKNATAVIGNCDSQGDADAARYLSLKGIKVICSSDRHVPLLIGKNTNVVGSAAFTIENGKAVFGNSPITISRNEPVIVMDTVSRIYGMEYYDTAARYFSELEKRGVKLDYFIAEVDDFNQMSRVMKRAKEKGSNVIAVAVINSDDYNQVKAWLEKDPMHKAILFASENSPYGYKIAREFRSQTSFDDPNPVVK
ncbi:MAG: hypothetical protein KJ955_04710 [Nanoarchaeota archaeon]|nr:hypothetical protein [Nanoarchaeota archaeon]